MSLQYVVTQVVSLAVSQGCLTDRLRIVWGLTDFKHFLQLFDLLTLFFNLFHALVHGKD